MSPVSMLKKSEMLLRSYSALYTVHEGMVLIVMLFVILFLEMHFRRQLFKALRLNKQINEAYSEPDSSENLCTCSDKEKGKYQNYCTDKRNYHVHQLVFYAFALSLFDIESHEDGNINHYLSDRRNMRIDLRYSDRYASY